MKTHKSLISGKNYENQVPHVRQRSFGMPSTWFFSKQSLVKVTPSPEPILVSSSRHRVNISGGGSDFENSAFETHRVEENASPESLENQNLIGLFDDVDEPKAFENGSLSKVKFQRFQVMDMSTGIIAMIGTFLTIMAYDLEFEQRDIKLLKTLLWMIFASTLIAIFLNVFTLLERIEYLKVKKMLPSDANIKNTGGIWVLLLETFTLLLQPYPFTRDLRINMTNVFENLSYYYDLNDLLSLLIVLRVYIILRFIINTTLYRSPRAQRITQMYGTTNDYLFACRCLTKKNPYIIVTISFGLSIFIFGYLLRICERPLNRNLQLNSNEFSSYWDSMWCVVVTMTVVGYGDYYPRTLFGKIVTLLICIWGVFVVSLIVVTLTNVLAMQTGQVQVLTVLERLELRGKLEKEAAFVLTNLAKIRLTNRRIKDDDLREKMNQKTVLKLKNHMQKLKMIDRTLRGVDNTQVKDQMSRNFLLLRNDIKDVMQEQTELIQTINTLKKTLEQIS